MMVEPIEQRAGEALGGKHVGPFTPRDCFEASFPALQ